MSRDDLIHIIWIQCTVTLDRHNGCNLQTPMASRFLPTYTCDGAGAGVCKHVSRRTRFEVEGEDDRVGWCDVLPSEVEARPSMPSSVEVAPPRSSRLMPIPCTPSTQYHSLHAKRPWGSCDNADVRYVALLGPLPTPTYGRWIFFFFFFFWDRRSTCQRQSTRGNWPSNKYFVK